MRRVIINLAIVALVLTAGMMAPWRAATSKLDGDQAMMLAASGGPVGAGEIGARKGNRFARVLGAPFRAIGRLFGHGKDDDRPRRLTEKDVKKFESAAMVRIQDSRTPATTAAPEGASGQPMGESGALGPSLSPADEAQKYLAAGRDLVNRGKFNEAVFNLSRAVSLDPRLSEAHNLLGVAYDRKNLPEMAKAAYERALHLDPRNAQILNNYGYSLYINGNYRAAVDRLKRAARLAPDDQRVLNNLALAQCRLGQYDDAYKSFVRAGGELAGHLNTAVMLERAGRAEDAIRHYEAARKLHPASQLVLQRLADLYQQTGQRERAEAVRRDLLAPAVSTASTAGNQK
jgi:Flp pilus assembly protein TadD